MVTKDLGMVTAYAYAVAGGYTGTEAEFTQLMADLAVVVDDFDNFSVNVTTLPAGSSATASYADGVLSLGIPKGDKGDKGNTGDTGSPAGFGTVSATVDANIGTPSVEVTASGSDTAKNFAFAFHNLKGQKGDKGDTGEVSEAELAEALEDFAENGTVANAEQLATKIRANDQTPYLFRTSGGSVDIGDREYINGIVGGTVAWNQLVNATSVTVPSGHKYYMVKGGTASIDTSSGSAITGLTSGTDMVIDLTLLFGSTIADYIYSLEQATAGAGVAFFKSLFPKPYYAYNAGELMSVKGLVSHDMVGFNAFDLTSGKAKVVGGHQYEIVGTYTSLSLDGETITPSSGKFTPSKDGELTVVGGNSTTCVHLVWDGSEDGNYEPYQKWSYPLDSDLELRGIPKLDASNNLYYDGDVYESDGTVTRKYGVAVLNGTQTPSGSAPSANPNGGYNVWFTYADAGMGDAKLSNAVDIPKLSDKFIYVPRKPSAGGDPQNDISIGSFSGNTLNLDGYIVFAFGSEYDTHAKINAWFAANPTTVIYELATPTEETADPYNGTQIVDDFGTEEFVISNTVTVPIPVGHNTDYPIDLKAKVEMAPNSPDGDGDYIVRQTNGTNEYVAFANNATIQNILSRLEALEG